MRVLIVEDEFLIALEVEEAVLDAGHEVVACVATVRQAMDTVAGEDVDLALLNIRLGDGKRAGLGLARTLAERHGIRTIFVSGQAADARSHAHVALGYLGKPFTREDIIAALDAAELMLRGEKPTVTDIPRSLELFEGRMAAPPAGKVDEDETC
jgi:DNA-binding response OmpR family regulator